MPPLKNYRVFISHAWSYSDDYNRMVNLLKYHLLAERITCQHSGQELAAAGPAGQASRRAGAGPSDQGAGRLPGGRVRHGVLLRPRWGVAEHVAYRPHAGSEQGDVGAI